MSVDQRSLPAYFNTDADFQAWCQGIAAQLVAAGLVKTTDTGQINNVTVVKPVSINTASGYEIYKFNDTLQGTVPIFLKVEYGSGGVIDRPGLWITIGASTNGAGTLATNSTRQQICANASKSAGVTLPSYCSGDGGRIGICNNYDSASNTFAFGFIVDRIRDGNGNATSEGFTIVAGWKNANQVQTILGGVVGASTGSAVFIGNYPAGTTPWGAGLHTYGANVLVWPLIVAVGQMRYLVAGVIVDKRDIAGGSQFSANTLNATHNYINLPSWNGIFNTDSTNDQTALLWE